MLLTMHSCRQIRSNGILLGDVPGRPAHAAPTTDLPSGLPHATHEIRVIIPAAGCKRQSKDDNKYKTNI